MNHYLNALFFVLAFATPSLCSRAAETSPLKIGVLGPRTGSAAGEGTAFEEGIALALEKLKSQGGRAFEVVFEDTGGGPEKAAAAVEKLVTKDNVSILVGESHSSAALAEIEVANRLEIPFVIAEAWSDDIFKKHYPWIFRAGPSNRSVVQTAIASFVKDSGAKNVAIVAENSDWGKGIAALTDSALGTLGVNHSLISVDGEKKDFYAEINKIKGLKPDLVLAYIYSFSLHSFVSQSKELGLSAHALLFDGAGPPSLWPEFWTSVGTAGEGELFLSSMHESVHPTPQSHVFWNAYKAKFHKEPSDYKIRSAYNVVLLAADALSRAGVNNPHAILKALEKTKFVGAAGTISFGTKAGSADEHQWWPQMLVIQWQNHKQVVVFPKQFATGVLQKPKS